MLAACASSPKPSGAAAAPSAAAGAAATASPSSTPDPTNPALYAALTADEVSSSGDFTQKSDGLLGGTPNTDSRVFTNTAGTLAVEIDLAVDSGSAAASSDYPAYQSAAAAQVSNTTSTPAASLGQGANEYVGTNSSGKMACSISFIEGRYIAVVTVVASGSGTATMAQSTAESVAQAQDSKMNSVGT